MDTLKLLKSSMGRKKAKSSPLPISLSSESIPHVNHSESRASALSYHSVHSSESQLDNGQTSHKRNQANSRQTFKLVVVSMCMLCNTFMSNIILPFMTFMVSRYDVPLELVGRYSGYLMSSYMFGQLLSSYYWGYLADTFGRRPTLIVGLLLSGISFLLFGIFNQTFYLTAFLRFMNGAFNGIAGITKTYVSEITTEETQAQGFAYLGVARSMGMILGPLVGGFLCLPAEKYPFIFPKGSLFDVLPFALPCLVGFIVAMTGAALAYIVLEETLTVNANLHPLEPIPAGVKPIANIVNSPFLRKHGDLTYHALDPNESESESGSDEASLVDYVHSGSTTDGNPLAHHEQNLPYLQAPPLPREAAESRRRYTHCREDSHSQRHLSIIESLQVDTAQIDRLSVKTNVEMGADGIRSPSYSTLNEDADTITPLSDHGPHDFTPANPKSGFDDTFSSLIDVQDDDTTSQPQETIFQLLGTRRVGMTMLVWTCVSALYIQFDEVFALWSRLPRSSQGLDFGSSEQGTIFTMGGIALGVYQMFLFSRVEKALGTVQAFRMGLLISIPAFILLPISYIFHADPNSAGTKSFEWGVWIVVGLAEMLRTIGGFQAFTTVFIMVSNSTTSKMRGSINGVGQTLGALGRMIGPVFAGTLFSFSLTNLNFVVYGVQMAPFIIFATLILFCILTWILSFHLSRTIGSRLPESSSLSTTVRK